MTITAVLQVLVGFALLILGRKVFWIFVAGIGFFAAMELVAQLAPGQPEWLLLVVGIIAGIIGSVLAIFLQQVAVAVAGFLAGGYIILALMRTFGLETTILSWVIALVGGIIGAILSIGLFDWALIILSSLSGASLVLQPFDLSPTLTTVLFVAAAIVGILIQVNLLEREEVVIRET